MGRNAIKKVRKAASAAALLLIATALPPSARAQRVTNPLPIRVEDGKVVVPVVVWNKHREGELQAMDPDLCNWFMANDPKGLYPWRDIPIRGLTKNDFILYEDGNPQDIESVTVAGSFISEARDNIGQHFEYIGEGGGNWVYPDFRVEGKFYLSLRWPVYLLSYTPKPSRNNCPKVKVEVIKHSGAAVVAGKQYCKDAAPTADPLEGTGFDKHAQKDLTSQKRAKVDMTLSALVFFSGNENADVHILAEFPSRELHFTLYNCDLSGLAETIGMVAKIYGQDGTELKSLSDFDCCNHRHDAYSDFVMLRRFLDGTYMLHSPRAYETDVSLPAGQYRLEAVVSDTGAFGRAETSFTVPAAEPQHLALSDVFLGKRFRLPQSAYHDPSQPMGAYHPLVSKGVEYSPTLKTVFHAGEPFLFYFQVHEPELASLPACTPSIVTTGRRCAPTVVANLRIVNVRTGTVARNLHPIEAASYVEPGISAIPIGGGIHISNLPRGPYRLEVQAWDSSGRRTPWRSVDFTIE